MPRGTHLEDRTALSTFTVVSAGDSGAGSLRAAIDSAVNGDVIEFAPTLYGKTITLSSVLAVGKSLTINGPGAGLLSLSGNNATRLLSTSGGVSVTLTGLTLTAASGSALTSSSGSLIISACVLSNNHSDTSGGGAISISGGSLTIERSTLRSNLAFSAFGGGALINRGGSVFIENSVFFDNSAINRGLPVMGGAIDSESGNVTIMASTFARNTVQNGSAGGALGGALFARAGVVSIVNSTFVANQVTSSFVSGSAGGALANAGASVTVKNSTIAGNSATSTFSDGKGGGIAVTSGLLQLQNTIVANNQVAGTTTSGPDIHGAVTSLGNNLIRDVNGATITGNVASNVTGVDPLLGTLQNNGGPTPTMALLAGSPAINRGNSVGSPLTDQRGFARVAQGAMDIGAYEAGAAQVSRSYAVGTDAGTPALVKVYNALTGTERLRLAPYGGYAGGVRVGMGDVNGDGEADVVTGTGPGAPGGHVKAFDGRTGAEIRSFLAFPGFTGGVFVAAGDINRDGRADIIVGAGSGPLGGHVKIFDGLTGGITRSFFAFHGFGGGVRVGATEANGDGFADIVVAAGAGGNGHIKVFDGRTQALLQSYLSFPGFAGEISMAASIGVIAVGASSSGGLVNVFDARDGQLLGSTFSFPGFTGSVRVGTVNRNLDRFTDILVSAGPVSSGGHIKVFDGLTRQLLDSFFSMDPIVNGTFVGGDSR